MPTTDKPRAQGPDEDGDEDNEQSFDPAEYDTLLQLEQLESLEEEMIEAGVTTIEELRERIARLHRELDV